MRLERWQPQNNEGVYLNEDLVFTFSSEVDFSTVTTESFRIVDDAGRPARGIRIVEGRLVRFEPAPVLSRDLSDGGYRPGTRYTVELVGFPRMDGLRGIGGEPLAGSLSWSFRTVSVPSEGLVFDDASPGTGELLKVASVVIAASDPIVLHCREPLDPSTLRAEDFQLIRKDGEPIELHVRLTANYDEGVRPTLEPCAVIELRPLRELEPVEHILLMGDKASGDIAARDFGGNRVWRRTINDVFHILVDAHDELRLTFLDSERFVPLEVPGSDGTAHWARSGAVTVRYPAAAGSGMDDVVGLSTEESRRDVNATRLSLDSGRVCELTGRGMRVLRAQGQLTISGDLRRTSGASTESMKARPDEDLTSWLARGFDGDLDWTVLIAGGDLVIDGSVEVDTPLMLVAGGLVRIPGRIRGTDIGGAPEVWLLGGGGGLDVRPYYSPSALFMDQPKTNPLREALTFRALSTQIPRGGRAVRWLTARAGGRHGSGEWRVRYVPLEGTGRLEEAVDHPRLLGGGPIRVLIELEVPVGGPWDPPSVDYVHLKWDH